MKNNPLYLFTFFFLIFPFFSFSQSTNISIPDSIASKSYKELHDIIQSHVFKTKTYSDAIIYTEALLLNSIKDNNNLEKARAYNYFYRINKNKGNFKEALNQVNKSIAIAEANNYDKNILRILYGNKSSALFYLGEYEKAIAYNLKELAIAKDLGDTYLQLKIRYNIALVKLDLGDKKGAMKFFIHNKKVYDSLSEGNSNKYLISRIRNLGALGKNYTSFKQLDSALIVYEEAYKLLNDSLPRRSTYIISGIGNVYTLQKKYAKALSYLENAQKLADSLEQSELIPYIYLHKARAYNGLKQHKKAIAYLNKVDTLIKSKKDDAYPLLENYILLAKSYDALGDYKKAKENYEKFILLDSESDSKKADIISSIYETYDIQSLETKIDDLDEKTTIQKAKLSTTKIIIGILCVIILLSIFIFRYKTRDTKQKFDALLKKLDSYEDEKIAPKRIERKKIIPEEKAVVLLRKLEDIERKKLFLNENCTISWLAKKMNTNSTYVSIVINNYKQKKFPEYITELRIDYATKRLREDRKFRAYTIQSIAQEVGYKSPKIFSKAFKKANGIYPSYFIKMIENQSTIAA